MNKQTIPKAYNSRHCSCNSELNFDYYIIGTVSIVDVLYKPRAANYSLNGVSGKLNRARAERGERK